MIINSDKKCIFEKVDEEHYFVLHRNKYPTTIIYILEVMGTCIGFRFWNFRTYRWQFTIKMDNGWEDGNIHKASPLEVILFSSIKDGLQERATPEEDGKLKEAEEDFLRRIPYKKLQEHLFKCREMLMELDIKINQEGARRESFINRRSIHKHGVKCLKYGIKNIKKWFPKNNMFRRMASESLHQIRTNYFR